MSHTLYVGILSVLALLQISALIWFWHVWQECKAEYAACQAQHDALTDIWGRWARAVSGEAPEK